jgi:hypothetical protein
MIGTLRRELLDRILIVNERHLRRILTVYLHHFIPRGHTGRWRNSHRPKPKPHTHKRSTSPTSRYAAKQSSTDSPTSISSPHDHTRFAAKPAGQTPEPYIRAPQG